MAGGHISGLLCRTTACFSKPSASQLASQSVSQPARQLVGPRAQGRSAEPDGVSQICWIFPPIKCKQQLPALTDVPAEIMNDHPGFVPSAALDFFGRQKIEKLWGTVLDFFDRKNMGYVWGFFLPKKSTRRKLT